MSLVEYLLNFVGRMDLVNHHNVMVIAIMNNFDGAILNTCELKNHSITSWAV